MSLNSIALYGFSEQPLKCHVNGKAAELKQVECKPPNNKFCNYIIDEEDKYVIDPIYDYIGARGCWCYEKQY